MSGIGWPCRASRCTISDAACNGSSVPYRERNPDKLLFTLEYPRQDIWRWLVAGDSVKTECDERVAQRRNEPARLAPVQQHERERDVLCVCITRFLACGSAWLASGRRLIADVTFLATARALAGEVAESDLAAGRVLPSLNRIREVSTPGLLSPPLIWRIDADSQGCTDCFDHVDVREFQRA